MPLEPIRTASPLGTPFSIRSRRTIQLGPLGVEIRSNELNFAGFRFFPAAGSTPDKAITDRADYTLSLCNLGIDGPWPAQMLIRMRDRSYRAGRFAAGYYITDHFGAPAYLVTQRGHCWIFAHDFEPILWPYVIKHLLTLYAMEHQMLHLKAAAVVVGAEGTLLVGRGGSGKTVLLTHLCRSGARFLSNTHVLVSDGGFLGIPTGVRVRADEIFATIIASRRLTPSVKAGEYVADPLIDLGWQGVASARTTNVCLVDYRGTTHCEIREMDHGVLFDYMDQFSLALNVYGLKEDILDHLEGDVAAFSVQVSCMRARLQALIETCRCYYVSCDVGDARNLQTLYDLLRAPMR